MEKIDEDDLGIFQNQDKVAENLKNSAEALGIKVDDETIDKLADGAPQEVYVSKKNCKNCWGKGTVDFARNKPKESHNHEEPPKFGEWRENNMTKALCSCVKVRLV